MELLVAMLTVVFLLALHLASVCTQMLTQVVLATEHASTHLQARYSHFQRWVVYKTKKGTLKPVFTYLHNQFHGSWFVVLKQLTVTANVMVSQSVKTHHVPRDCKQILCYWHK